MLAEVEAIVNCRPLAQLCEDSSDTLALTPSHILIGKHPWDFQHELPNVFIALPRKTCDGG